MRELDFSSKKNFRVKFSEEESYVVRLPSISEARDFGKKSKKSEDEYDQIDLTIELLIKLGLPEDRAKALDLDQLLQLKDMVFDFKKK